MHHRRRTHRWNASTPVASGAVGGWAELPCLWPIRSSRLCLAHDAAACAPLQSWIEEMSKHLKSEGGAWWWEGCQLAASWHAPCCWLLPLLPLLPVCAPASLAEPVHQSQQCGYQPPTLLLWDRSRLLCDRCPPATGAPLPPQLQLPSPRLLQMWIPTTWSLWGRKASTPRATAASRTTHSPGAVRAPTAAAGARTAGIEACKLACSRRAVSLQLIHVLLPLPTPLLQTGRLPRVRTSRPTMRSTASTVSERRCAYASCATAVQSCCCSLGHPLAAGAGVPLWRCLPPPDASVYPLPLLCVQMEVSTSGQTTGT